MMKIIVTFLLFFTASIAGAKDYYVDAENGHDRNSGQTEQKAWASLKKVNKKKFKAGDRLLFRADTKYHGQLVIKSSGTEEKPIIVSAYGDGARPQIHGKGRQDYTLLLENAEYIVVSGLDITNMGKERKAGRAGVVVRAFNSGELHHVVLKNLTIRHVNGSLKKKEDGGRAIHVQVRGDRVPSRFIDFQILDNHIYHTSRNGIGFGGIASRANWFPHLQVVIRGNLMEQVPGDGIVVVGSDGALIEGNVLRDFPDILPLGEAAAGIWPWSSDNTVIQFNEVSGHKAKWDAQGYDSDFNSIGTIIQNNFSHDNYGGFLLVCNNGEKFGQDKNIGTKGSIIRNNVSFNDGIRPYPTNREDTFSPIFHLTGPIEDTRIYGNVIIVPRKEDGVDNTLVRIENWGDSWPQNSVFEDNDFYIEGEMNIDLNERTDVLFRKNRFFGKITGFEMSDNVLQASAPLSLKEVRNEALMTKVTIPAQTRAHGISMVSPPPVRD